MNIRLIVFITFLIAQQTSAQGITMYTFGSIGDIGNHNPIYTGSIEMQGSECFMIKNGVAVMLEKNQGAYFNSCEVNPSIFDVLSISAYPNPISTYTRLKLTKQQFILNDEKVQLQLFNQKGYLIQQTTINLSQLNNGFDFEIRNVLNNGIYFFKAFSPSRIYKTLTLLKQD